MAALSVLLYHLYGDVFIIGAAGVDVLFIISGFIMGTTATKNSPSAFLFSRLARVVPLYWLVTLVMCAGALAGVFSTFAFTPEYLLKSLLFIPYTDPTGSIAPLVMVGWTLNIEMMFYAVFALGLLLGSPIAFTAFALALMALTGAVLEWTSPIIIQWTSQLLLEFLAGLLLSQLRWQNMRHAVVLPVISIVLFATANALDWRSETFRLLTWGVPSLILVAGCLSLEGRGLWPDILLKPFEKLGNASYALYLTHGLVISFTYKLLGHGQLSNLAAIALSVIVAFCTYYLFEKPTLKFFKQRMKRRASVSAVSPAE